MNFLDLYLRREENLFIHFLSIIFHRFSKKIFSLPFGFFELLFFSGYQHSLIKHFHFCLWLFTKLIELLLPFSYYMSQYFEICMNFPCFVSNFWAFSFICDQKTPSNLLNVAFFYFAIINDMQFLRIQAVVNRDDCDNEGNNRELILP